MVVSIESRLKKHLKNIEIMKTPSCLDTDIIGFYIENKLPKGERMRVEKHISSCLYCLNQLTELKELIFFQKQKVLLPSSFLKKIGRLYPKRETSKGELIGDFVNPLIRWIGDFFALPFRQWRYALVSVAAAAIAIFITLSIKSTEKEIFKIPEPKDKMLLLGKHEHPGVEKGYIGIPTLNPDSFVRLQAISNEGKVLSEAQGVVIDSKGLVASNLYPLVGANLTQITLKDGRTYRVKNIWKDEEKNLALMKIEGESFPALQIADMRQIYIGQKVLIIPHPFESKKGIKTAVVSDFKGYPSRGLGGKIQYIQIASFITQSEQGALVDQQGKLIGFLITQEKEMNLAAPIKEFMGIVREQTPIPINELKSMRLNPEALNYYFKGILARDARRNDEAIELFKKAIELNPDLEGPHLELGLLYYDNRLYDLEMREYQEALRINPRNTDALFYLGEVYETKGLYELAIKEYEKVIKLDPEDATAYYNLGLTYLTQGQKEKALEMYPKLKRLDPGFAEKLKRLAK